MPAHTPELVIVARGAYVALLQLAPHDWRIKNQRLLCDLRDEIAKATGNTPQRVQEECEEAATVKRVFE